MSSSSTSDFECPITGSLFIDPVSTVDGQTYERSAIQRWFSDRHDTSPATGQRLPSLTLIPNIAMRKACDSMRSSGGAGGGAVAMVPLPASSSPAPALRPFKSAKVQVGARKYIGRDGNTYLQLQAYLPSGPSDEGADYIVAFDQSGSMDTPAWVKVDKGEMGITRLDLGKHVLRTIATMLGPNDRIAIVAFNDRVTPLLGLTPMNEAGRRRLDMVLNGIASNNTTNIYGAVEECAKIANSAECKGRRIVGLLLTDGVPTESIPPVTGGRKTMPMIQERIKCPAWTFHTMGFSSDINSLLLEQLAVWGNGRMLFVPSGDMVSTNGINLAAYEKTVASLGTTIHYVIDGIRAAVETGPLATGQRRDFCFQIKPDADVRGVEAANADPCSDLGSSDLADCRRDFVETLTGVIDGFTDTFTGYADEKAITSALSARLMTFHKRHATVADPSVKAVLRDVVSKVDGEGQCLLALDHLRPADWGLHYLRAYRDHMRAGICMNFKDPGLKVFETPEFLAHQTAGDTAFASIPPPPIQRRGMIDYTVPVTSAYVAQAFNNSSGSCFEGSTEFRMADGSVKTIGAIRPGDKVYTPSGPATVVHRATFHTSQPSQPLVQFSPQTGVTPWHPCREVLADGTFGPWTFPADLQQFAARKLPTVYNLVLDQGHIVESGKYQFVTLGHGFEEAPLKHAFFGTEACIQALEDQPGANQGMPVYLDCVATKDPDTGLITGWIDEGREESNVNGSCNII